MCYSAMVRQGVKSGLRWKARLQTDRVEELFRRRLRDDSIKIAKAFEANFHDPQTPGEEHIKRSIDEYHRRKAAAWETEIFKQRKRLADAERKLKEKETKKALEDRRIATYKVSWLRNRIADLNRTTLVPDDSRIFPFWHAPVLTLEDNELVISPMRYHCRPHGKPAWYDTRYPGLYNARRDNLEGFWKESFGRKHAVLAISSFYENVARHDYEKRALRPDEKAQNVVLQFNPRPAAEMYVACVWDRWRSHGQPDLYSFAVITDDPPPEIAATGHDRCPIPLKADNVGKWLRPEQLAKKDLYALLDDRERFHYAHELAA
ncbi:MAG TPA: SOS response-associated peptidase family protein [Burkholderiales bacterium]|nr:SOS response-associated peptidase family protein [Burkholderiales bacterium]